MPPIFFPPRNTKILKQSNRSKILGSIWASFGLDLQSELGLIKASPPLKVNTASVANQGLSVAFKTFDKVILTIAGTRIFKSTDQNLLTGFTEDASSGAETAYSSDYSDMAFYNNVLCTTTTAKLMTKATDGSGGGAWTKRYDLTAGDSPHKLCYLPGTNRLYFIDDYQTIKSMYTDFSIATSGSYFISIPYTSGAIYTMLGDKTNIWIGTMKSSASGLFDLTDGASILLWDGISATATSEYKIKAQGVLALGKDDFGIVHAIDTEGNLLKFNGDGFNEIDRLPLNKELLTNASTTGGGTKKYDAFIHPNGFIFGRNGTFLALINNLVGDSAGSIKENLPSGVWEWSKDTGFIHRQPISASTLGSSSIIDYGQNRILQAGALYEPNIYSTSANGKPMLICGANYYTDASVTASGIFVDESLTTTQKFAYFVSSWIQSQNLKDNWQKLFAKYRKLLNSADRIWIKYRTTEATAVEFSLTWSGLSPTQTTFTTTTDLSALVGYEVEIVQGTGSGKCAHIVSVANNAGTYTVILDEPFTGVTTGTAKARYQAWIKAFVVSDQITESLLKTIPGVPNSERIQLKVCIQFTGDDELHEVGLINGVSSALQ